MKNKHRKSILGLLTAALCSVMLLGTVVHADIIDVNRDDCTIDYIMQYTDETGNKVDMNSGTVGLYLVARVVNDDTVGQRYDIEAEGCQFADLQDIAGIPRMTQEQLDANRTQLCRALVATVSSENTTPYATSPVANGLISFGNETVKLSPGLYLLYQTVPTTIGAEQTATMAPFLLSIPYQGEYNITGEPKMAPTMDISGGGPDETEYESDVLPSESNPPKETNPPTGGNTPPGGTSSKLPQTGQLWWPVPILGCAGVLLLIAGIVRRRRSH